ncbi:unnamed protein product [Mytilus coruscus]|uniref:Uncharacterized protein n=1 Tax=Mytilus coruscus TaxID=42192 RepID=A0A6J8AUY4_MYTCO|nr:unnamed protein product [Mytilus coruscus]
MERMPISKSESLNFYKYLCQKIGSEKVVRTRRLVFTIMDMGHGQKMITSGSIGEGLNLTGSDLDYMFIDIFFKVYQSETEVQSQCRARPLIMNTEETQFNTKHEEQLTTILTNLYDQGINCFASSETLHDFQSQSHESTESLIFKFLQQIMPALCAIGTTFPSVEYYQVLRLLYSFLHISRTALSRGLFAFQISKACLKVPEVTQYAFSSGNKQHYSRYKHDLSHLVIGLYSDAVSGLLMLASFFYVHKNYKDSLTMITYALQKCTEEKIYTIFFRSKKTFNSIQKHMMNLMKKEKLFTIMKSLTIHPCGFEVNSSIIPQELQLDVSRMHTVFHTLPFAHFLSFLCYYHLHDILSCRQSLQRLGQWILSDCGNIVFDSETLNTIIFHGIGNQLIGETYVARLAFRVAAKFDEYNTTSAASRLSSLTS